MFKKAQAAMEFLMTYGWAILVVLAAIAALAYFGVLSPDRFLPEKCTMPSGIACLDFSVSGNNIILSLQNAAGFDMTGVLVDITADIDPNCIAQDGDTTAGSLANGQKDLFTIPCTGLPPTGQKFKGTINMTFTNTATTLNHAKVGEVILKMP